MFIRTIKSVSNVAIAAAVAVLVYFLMERSDPAEPAYKPIIPVTEPVMPDSIPFTGDGGPGLGLSFETLLY